MRLSKSSRKFWCIFQTRRSFPLIIYLVIYQTLHIWKEIRKKVLLNKIKLYFRCYIQRKRNIFNKKKKKGIITTDWYNVQIVFCRIWKQKKKKKKENLLYQCEYIWYLYEISFSRFKASGNWDKNWMYRIADCSINHERLLRRNSSSVRSGRDRLAWNISDPSGEPNVALKSRSALI